VQARIFVVVELIIFCVEKMCFRIDVMESEDLFLSGNELISFLGVAGNGDAANGKFEPPLRFNGRCDDGVVPEDFFDFVGIGCLAADADAGVAVVRELGAAKAEGIGRPAYQ